MIPEDELKGQTIRPVSPAAETVREQDRFQLVLAYLAILALIPLLTAKDSEFVQWHARNGLVLGVGGLIALAIVSHIPFLGCLAGPVLFAALVAVGVMAMVKA